jgi:hypothetical protein
MTNDIENEDLKGKTPLVVMKGEVLEEIMDIVQDAQEEVRKARTYWVAMMLVVAFYIGYQLAEAFLG